MLSDGKIDKYSDVLLWALKAARRNKFQKNDIILIRYNLDSVKLAESMMAKLLELGMNPVMRMGLTSKMERDFFGIANNKQLVFHAPGDKALYKSLNGGIYLNAPVTDPSEPNRPHQDRENGRLNKTSSGNTHQKRGKGGIWMDPLPHADPRFGKTCPAYA